MKTKLTKLMCTLFATMVCIGVNAQATSGNCGEKATWNYDSGVLTISGTGAMSNYTDALTDAPWNDYRTSITEVIIGDGITHIGNWAFMGFTSLTNVTIGESVESIGHEAFDNCNNAGFTKLNIPNSVKTIGMFAFSNNHLKYICMGSGITSIGREAFCLCPDLEYVGIYALTPPTYGMDAFSAVPNLKAIFVDNYCRSNYAAADGWSAFADIIQIPYGICGDSGMGDEPTDAVHWSLDMMSRTLNITGTGAIKDFSSMGGPTAYPWNNPAINPLGGEYNMFWTGIESITIGKNVTNVPDWAFAMQMNCASVKLPATITSIGSSALEECAFTSIDLPEGLETIADYAFYGSKLISLVIPSTVTTIGGDAFLDNADLAYVTCARTTTPTALADGAFGDGSSLTAIFVPEGTATAYKAADGWSAYAAKIQDVPTTTFTYTATEKVTKFDEYSSFRGALNVKSHDYADGAGTVVYTGYVTALGNLALSYTKLTDITIPESITSFDSGAFQSSKLETVTFTGTPALTTIGPRAFNSCSSLTTFIVPPTVTTIGASAFSGCSNLATFTFADTPVITSIGNAAFQDCTKLTAFTIPESVTILGRTVFWFAGLTSLYIPAGVTSIGQALFCSSPITSLTVDAGNSKYADLGCNGIFDKLSNKLIAGGAATVVPDGIVAIGQEAFWGEEGIFSLSLPESVTTIESRAFHMARGLISLSIPSGITYIDEECFFFCDGMQDVYCYASPTMTWDGGMEMPAFNLMTPKATQFHVAATDLDTWTANFPDANVTFVGDLIALADNSSNNDIINNNHGQNVSATLVGRTLYRDGKWNTICLPFDVTIAGSALEGAEARTLTSASISGTTLNLTFGDPVATLQAGTPYIIKWAEAATNIENPSFTGITINKTDNSFDTGTGDERVRFEGTYHNIAFTDTNKDGVLLLGGDNNLYYAGNGARLGAQRAYFRIGGDNAALARMLTSFNIDFSGEGTTCLGTIDNGNMTIDNEANAWYTLAGHKLQGRPTKKGVYVNRGQKVVIK